MDRLLYLAMTGAHETMRAQRLVSNNLANATTTGFRADLETVRSLPMHGPVRVSSPARRSRPLPSTTP